MPNGLQLCARTTSEPQLERAVLSAVFWIALYLGVITVPLLILLLGDAPPGRGFVWDLAIALGFAGVTMMAVQFVLTARFRRASAPYGIDIIYYFHRYAAVVALVAVVAHPLLIVADEPAYVAYLDPRSAPWHMTSGLLSVLALIVLVATSVARKQLHIHYGGWRYSHLFLAIVAVVAALAHIEGVGYYAASPAMRKAWLALIALWTAVVVYVRVVRPALVMRAPYRVVEVRRERGDAWTIAVEPSDDGDGIEFAPGQFVWLTLRSRPFAMKDHPFSIASSAEQPRRLEFTIKELGDFTRTIGDVAVGEIAYVDGPHGAFTIDRYDSRGLVVIAGGIGAVPIMSMLRTLADRGDRRPVLFFYACRRWERMTFRESLEDLVARIDLRIVFVLEEPPEAWTGAHGRVTQALLDQELPADRTQCEYFVCGPTEMIRSVETSLHGLGVPLARAHSELFELV